MSNVELKQLGSEYLQSPQCPKLELVKLHASNKCKIQKNEQCMLILMNNVALPLNQKRMSFVGPKKHVKKLQRAKDEI